MGSHHAEVILVYAPLQVDYLGSLPCRVLFKGEFLQWLPLALYLGAFKRVFTFCIRYLED